MSSSKRRKETRRIRKSIGTITGAELVAQGKLPPFYHLGIGWDGESTIRRIGGLSVPVEPNPFWKKMKDSLEQ